jgi:hypothetical protein
VVEDHPEELDAAGGWDGDVTDDEGDWAVVVTMAVGGDEVGELELGKVKAKAKPLRARDGVACHVSSERFCGLLHAVSSLDACVVVNVAQRSGSEEFVCVDEIEERAEG